MLSIPILALAGAIALLALLAFIPIYNVIFHPLRSYRGPLLAVATPFPRAYHRFMGDQHQWVLRLHDHYGSVVRYSPEMLSYTDPTAWRDIYGHKHAGERDMPKKGHASDILGGKDSILSMDDVNHSRTRRLLSHAMSDRAIREQQPILLKYISALVGRIHAAAVLNGDGNRGGQSTASQVELVSLYNFTTFDVMTDLTFGESMGMLASGEWTPWIKAINDGSVAAIKLGTIRDLIPTTFSLLHTRVVSLLTRIFLPAGALEALRTHFEFSRSQVDKRLARDTERPDFWTYILRNSGGQSNGTPGEAKGEMSTGSGLTTIENHAMGMTLVFAGSETTATAATGLTRFLLEQPAKYARLAAEIRSAFPSVEPSESNGRLGVDMDMDRLASLPYFKCCIQEALRLYPPVSTARVRQVPAGGRRVGDRFVSEGTEVGVSHYAAYRTAANWHRPNDFIPERWEPAALAVGSPFANDNRDVLQPFSFGPRNCIGKNLAYHELRMIIASVIWHFDFELAEEAERERGGSWWRQPSYIVHVKPPLMVVPRLVKREGSA